MLKRIFILLSLFFWQSNAGAADLLKVYQQALHSDTVFQQAVAQSLVTRDNVPISISYILPNISVFANPTVSRYGFSGTEYRTGTIGNVAVFDPRNLTQRTYTLDLTLTQPVFNFGLFANIAVQLENAKSACASLNAALQSLMIRVARAYFAILKDEEIIAYTNASKQYYQYQLNQVTDQFQAGIKTKTDVYTARAAYESSVAGYIAANKQLANDRENLRVITNVYYAHLSYLKNDFPLASPHPENINQWVDIALRQNWSIKAAQYTLGAARQNIRQQYAGHLPVVTLQSTFARDYTYNINRYVSFADNNGAGTISDKSIGFNVDFPVFEGGGVISKTNQAKHLYEQQQQALEENVRITVNNTRQSYMNIIAGISQIKADRQVISAAIESLQGTIDRYNSGIQTLLDVLNREATLYEAQVAYAVDRYDLVNNILLLKEAAGTLSFEDIRIVNSWLIDSKNKHIIPYQEKLIRKSQSNVRQNIKNQSPPLSNKGIDKNLMQAQADTRLTNLIDQIREETRESYKKLENQNQRSSAEITALKSALSELRQELKNKNDQLKVAMDKVNQSKQ